MIESCKSYVDYLVDCCIARQKYDDEIKLLNISLKSLQDRCKHEKIEYITDPSGNNDSYNVCCLCGKDI